MKKIICVLSTIILFVFSLTVTAFADTLKENCLDSLYVGGEEKDEISAVVDSYGTKNFALKSGDKSSFSVSNYYTIDTEAITPVYIVDTQEFIQTGKVILSPSMSKGEQEYQALLASPKGEYWGKATFTVSGDTPGIGTYYTFSQNPQISENDFEYNIDEQLKLIRDYGFNEENIKVTFVLCDYVGDCYYVTDGEKEAFLCGGDTKAFYDDNKNLSLIAPVEQVRAFVKEIYLDYQKAAEEWAALNKDEIEDEDKGIGGGTGASLPDTGENDNIAVVFTGFCISLAGIVLLKRQKNQ